MAWLRRNLIAVAIAALALCAVSALALETAKGEGALARLFGGADTGGGAAGMTAAAIATAGASQQSGQGSPPGELVNAWEKGSRLCSYDLSLSLDPAGKRMDGTLNFTYVNTESVPMSELHFLLYANSYQKLQYGIFEAGEIESAYPNGFSPGSIAIRSVQCAGSGAKYWVEGAQNQVLRVKLPEAVAPGGTASLTISYTVTIPNCWGRFGYGDDTMSLVNCNPILAVYDNGVWYDYPYYAVGDPFYSETADYHATIRAPAGWTIAATGVLGERQSGSGNVWTVDAPGRRDFGFVASDDFCVLRKDVDGVLVRSYYLPGDGSGGSEALDTAAQAISLYDATFGQYPYGEYSVVEADFFIGGMEYPGMTLIDESLYKAGTVANKAMFDLVVAHETGHMWWYSTIGDDEVAEPWLDEGLTEFTTQYFFERDRSAEYNDFYKRYNQYFEGIRKTQEGEYSAEMPVYRFDGNESYSAWVYARSAEVFQDLRKSMGDEKFFSALREYYSGHRLGITTGKDLEKAFEDVSGRDLTQWFDREMSASGG